MVGVGSQILAHLQIVSALFFMIMKDQRVTSKSIFLQVMFHEKSKW